MIGDDVVDRVRSAADIVAIIQQFGVPLRRHGSDYRGPCPFHGGKNPNFSVSPKLGSYHCFVCHEKGDVFTFVRKKDGLDFVAAVKLIGDIVGIEVIDAPARAQAPDPNEPFWEVLSTAAAWFRTQLAADAGRAAREYLESRQLGEDAKDRFGIGYAPSDAQSLRRYLHSLGFDDERQRAAGLLVQREGDAEPRMPFRDRIMLPILDEQAHHVGFGGRALSDRGPKYLNSSESAVFQKRRTLYGLHTARQAMRRAGRAIVVEGYFDVIRLAMAGLEEVVAPLGTALTEEQAGMLARYATETFLLYDSDAAGQKATFRSGIELLQQRTAVRVVSLPDGEDPDTFVRGQGRAAMEVQLTQAIDLFDRQVQLLERRGWFADLRHQRRAIDKLLPTIRAAADPLTRDQYLTRLSDVSHLDKATLLTEANEVIERGRRRSAPPADAPSTAMTVVDTTTGPPSTSGYEGSTDAPPAPYAASKRRDAWKASRKHSAGPEWQASAVRPRPGDDEPAERALVRAMLVDRHVSERVATQYRPESFRDPEYRALFAALLAAGPSGDLETVAATLDEESILRLRDMTEQLDGADPDAADVALNLAKLDARALRERCDALRLTMHTVRDEESKNALLAELLTLERELRQLQPMRSVRGIPRR